MSKLIFLAISSILSISLNAFSQGPFACPTPMSNFPCGHIVSISVCYATDADNLGTVTIQDDCPNHGWYQVSCVIPSRLNGGQELLATLLTIKSKGGYANVYFSCDGNTPILRRVDYK